jgi:hypothetical protein
MKKEDINNILLVNGYLVSCELDKNCCEKKIQLTRKYLSERINKALKSRTEKTPTNFKALLVNTLLVLGFNL